MPVYHFNVHDGASYPDLEGHEFPSLEVAKAEAVKFAGHLIHDMGPQFWKGHEWKMEVTDADGLTLFCLTFFGTLSPFSMNK